MDKQARLMALGTKPNQRLTRAKSSLASLAVLGAFATANNASVAQTAPANAPTSPSQAAPVRAGAGTTIYPANPLPLVPQILYPAQGNLLADPHAPHAAGAAKSKMPHGTSRVEATPVIAPPEKVIPLLGPVLRADGRAARVVRPFLTCTVEILEHGVLVSHQTMGCAQTALGVGERPTMLMEFGQEVPNAIPNMKYWLSVQVDGYRQGYPILRTRMELKGLLGRTVGRRKYESVTFGEPNKRHTAIAFNIDDDDFEVAIVVRR